ncbi:MAG: phosphoribosylanthranilate isomerase [Halioglobus sp.]|nr:phosphoribosylanthranilate isomerase [Halioglobus sp.]
MIKICGLTDKAAVAAAVAAGADAVGFVFADSPRRVSAGYAAEIAADVPREVLRVAVMRHPSDAEWQNVLTGFEPDVLQTDAADLAELDIPASVALWPVYREDSIELADSLPATFLYEGENSGSGEPVDWVRAAEYARRGRMILAGGLCAGNVAAAIVRVAPWGVDVSSAVESAPGCKDTKKIAAFIKAARSVDAN